MDREEEARFLAMLRTLSPERRRASWGLGGVPSAGPDVKQDLCLACGRHYSVLWSIDEAVAEHVRRRKHGKSASTRSREWVNVHGLGLFPELDVDAGFVLEGDAAVVLAREYVHIECCIVCVERARMEARLPSEAFSVVGVQDGVGEHWYDVWPAGHLVTGDAYSDDLWAQLRERALLHLSIERR